LICNKGNAKRGVSPRLQIWPGDLNLWPWKSIGFQILLRTKYVPSLVKIHWRMLILVFTRMLRGKNLTWWPWQSIGFQILLRTKYVPSLVKIHSRMLILECSQGCYGRTVALLYPFVGERIIKQKLTTKEISIFSNSRHFEWRAGLSDTILKGDHPSQICFNLVQRFQRRRFKCDLLSKYA
jgi:hypothetical protein